ncbi:sulfatase [Haloarculaceae archaeon H-GB11]|nr:sulfatase [Haloarculaceae archaeon H-GB11]
MSDVNASGTLLVTVDSLRADGVEFDGDAATTPQMGALAEQGTVFENAFAQGNWTPFSFPSILGGTPVFTDTDALGPGRGETLPSALSDAGVETGGFNAANGFLTEHWAYDEGFDAFETFVPDGDGRIERFRAAHPTANAWLEFLTQPLRSVGRRLRGAEPSAAENASRMQDVERRAIEFLETAEPPFFCWIHYMDTHTPYVPAPKHVRAVSDGDLGTAGMFRAHLNAGLGRAVDDDTLDDLRTLYRAAARQVDESIGRVLDALSERGLRDETCVVLAGDHGEEFQEHGHLAHYPKLYGELVEVPLVVDVPGVQPDREDAPVGLDAIPPTVCDAMGVPSPPSFSGESLLPAMAGSGEVGDDPVVSVTVRGEDVTQQPIPRRLDEGDVLLSARTADWTYIRNTETDEVELYDRRRDAAERHDRWDDRPAESPVDRLEAATAEREALLGGDGTEPAEQAAPDAVESQLKALGYR